MKLLQLSLGLALLTIAACHPGPVVGKDPQMANVGGTIAGIVSGDGNVPLGGRKVTAINTETGTRYDATTGTNGGYTIQVPQGSYKLEVQLQPGEKVAKQPDETRINKSDLDPHRDFVIAGAKGD
jgi:hypothetical protein